MGRDVEAQAIAVAMTGCALVVMALLLVLANVVEDLHDEAKITVMISDEGQELRR